MDLHWIGETPATAELPEQPRTFTAPDAAGTDRWVGQCVLSVLAREALKSGHAGGINGLFGDGSVRFVPDSIDMTVYKNIADRADGNANEGFLEEARPCARSRLGC